MIKKSLFPKLALELIGYLLTSIVIAGFSWAFLYFISIAFVSQLIEKGYYTEAVFEDPQLTYGITILCILASMVVFLTFFLLFVGEKVSYILSITKAIQSFKSGDLSFRIEHKGDDELTDLAETINSFSIALQNHMDNEQRLKNEKEALIRSLSHDIRTPLTAIVSYADFIREKRYDNEEKLMQYTEIIQKKACQIQDLTLLLLNKESTSLSAPKEHPLDGRVMFEQFLCELTTALEDGHFDTEVDKLGLTDFETTLSTQDMARIFDNLYSNIKKYADNQQKIKVKVALSDHQLILTQTNTVKSAHLASNDSHGLGLKSIEQIVSRYHGQIQWGIAQKVYKIEIKLPI